MVNLFSVAFLALALGLNAVSGETIEFSFHALRHTTLDETQLIAAPFPECWVYLFEQTSDDDEVFEQLTASPARTDANGTCAFSFEEDRQYWLYFSGKPLSEAEIAYVKANNVEVLIPFAASIVQSRNADFEVVTARGQRLAILDFSFPLWLTHFHKLEAELRSRYPDITEVEILTKCRKLFDRGGYWQYLLPSNTKHMVEFNAESGAITRHDVPLALTENVARAYRRSAGAYELLDGRRQVVSRFDIVSLRGDRYLRIDRVLFGFETSVVPAPTSLRIRLKNVASAATWARDLGRTCFLAVHETNRPPSEEIWIREVAANADEMKIAGGILGCVYASPFGELIQDDTTVGQALESLINKGMPKEEDFWDALNVETEDQSSRLAVLEDLTARSASAWSWTEWDRLHSSSQRASLQKASSILIAAIPSDD